MNLKALLGNVFTSPRTTLAGLLSVTLAAVLASVIPAVVTYLGAQPGVGWKLVGLALGALLGGGILADAKAPPAAK